MKAILTILILFCCLAGNAQNIFYNSVIPYDYYSGVGKRYLNRIKLAGVQQQENSCYSNKGKLAWKNVNTYNSAGFLTVNEYYKKGELQKRHTNVFKNDTLYTGSIYIGRKGDTITRSLREYDEQGREVKFIQTRGHKRSETHYAYNRNGKKEKSVMYKNGKLKGSYEYVYNNEGKMTMSLQYNAKNKLVRQTSYQCDYRGEAVAADVKQVNMCLRKDSSGQDGGYIVYNDRTDEKGRLTRSIYRYDKDTNMVSYENFSSKGKLISRQLYAYDAAGNNIEGKIYRRGKMRYSYRYNYNQQNLVVLSSYLSKEGDVKSKQVYQYRYF